MRKKSIIFIFLLTFVYLFPLSALQKSSIPDAARLQVMLRKLTVVANVLYVGAHPDDENTAVLAHLSLGRGMRAAYLALNRGEGGQNLIGPEQGALLGMIRTQELLAAREVDGAEQFFTRAVDFGYSKSAEESLRIWGHENVLSDVTWVVRKFRPDVIITRFPPDGGGHGHHTASSILAGEAFLAAADPARFPEQLKYVRPWQPKRVVWNRYSWGNQPQLTEQEKANYAQLNVGEYSAVLGKSFTEIAGIGRSMHKSQGFGDSQDRGAHVEYFRHTAGEPSGPDLFSGIDLTWNRIEGGKEIGPILLRAYETFDSRNPSASLPLLLQAYERMQSISGNPWVDYKLEQIKDAIRACAGLWLEAIAQDYSVTSSGSLNIQATAINRSSHPITWDAVEIAPGETKQMGAQLSYNKPESRELQKTIDANRSYTQPYWLQNGENGTFADVDDPGLIGMPESPPPVTVRFHFTSGNHKLTFTEPVLYRWVDPVRGEQYRGVEILPPVTVNLEDRVMVFKDDNSKQIQVHLRGGKSLAAGKISLNIPPGWNAEPESVPFQLQEEGDTATVRFQLKPAGTASIGRLQAVATTDSGKTTAGIVTIDYPHIGPHTIFPPATARIVKLQINAPTRNIGYVMGSGDQIPSALEQIGYTVTLLSDNDLLSMPFERFDSMIIGVRAYNTREVLRDVQAKLMRYVEQGGTLVVQYQTMTDLVTDNLGPYPFRISRDRVSVEEAEVRFVNSNHPLLNAPNKITQEDFQGWVQERGLYFPGEWDPKYETILESNDPGEPGRKGGTLVATYGKGTYIYTAYSWFRQLPAGVPGAFRIFVNLISAGSKNGRSQ